MTTVDVFQLDIIRRLKTQLQPNFKILLFVVSKKIKYRIWHAVRRALTKAGDTNTFQRALIHRFHRFHFA